MRLRRLPRMKLLCDGKHVGADNLSGKAAWPILCHSRVSDDGARPKRRGRQEGGCRQSFTLAVPRSDRPRPGSRHGAWPQYLVGGHIAGSRDFGRLACRDPECGSPRTAIQRGPARNLILIMQQATRDGHQKISASCTTNQSAQRFFGMIK
jgi:hypothetical protein